MKLRVRPRASAPGTVPSAAPAWADALASLDDGLVLLDADGWVVNVNPAAEQLVGISAAQAVGLDVENLFARDAWIAEVARGTLREATGHRRREGTIASHGREIAVSAACTPVLDDDGGEVRGAVLVLHDLTMDVALEATTRRDDRLGELGTVAQGLAHEIRNPLGGIKGAAQLLRSAVQDPELARCSEIIIREVERLDGLVEQLRELGTRPRLELAPLNIHRVLNDVLTLQRQAPTWNHVELETTFDPSLPPVLGDRAQLAQVFLNLVRNALDALGGTGKLIVSTRMDVRFHIRRASRRRRNILVLVEDTGPGVPEADQARLFAPFFSTKAAGTGLGLSLCHRILSEHGGSIAYEPRRGGGTRFRVALPVSPDHVGG